MWMLKAKATNTITMLKVDKVERRKHLRMLCPLPIRPNSEESEFFFETQLLIYYPVLYCEFKTSRKLKRMNGTVENKFNEPFHTLEVELCSKTSTNSLF